MGNINGDSKRVTLMSAELNATNPENLRQTYSKGEVSNETQELDNSGNGEENAQSRSPFATAPTSPVYNRFKYYSALRTGYQ